jgi:ketosteroid isomerase-like protein
METETIEQKAQEFIDALHALEQGSEAELAPLVDKYAEDARLTNAALELKGETSHGKEAIRAFWSEYKQQLGQMKSNFHHVTTSDRAAGLFWTTEGTNPQGQEIHYHGVSLLEFNEQGLIQFFRGYYDTRELQLKAQ